MKNSESKAIVITLPFKAICVDDKNRPAEIPITNWLVEGQPYTIINARQLPNGETGFIVEEIPLGEETFPYFYLSSSRFGIPMTDKEYQEYLKQSEPESLCQEEPVLL